MPTVINMPANITAQPDIITIAFPNLPIPLQIKYIKCHTSLQNITILINNSLIIT